MVCSAAWVVQADVHSPSLEARLFFSFVDGCFCVDCVSSVGRVIVVQEGFSSSAMEEWCSFYPQGAGSGSF